MEAQTPNPDPNSPRVTSDSTHAFGRCWLLAQVTPPKQRGSLVQGDRFRLVNISIVNGCRARQKCGWTTTLL